MADDVGWNDVSYNRNITAADAAAAGGRIESYTPNIDALARGGIRLDQHTTDFMCTPSRCSFLTGRLPVHVQQGQAFPETPSAGIPRNMTTIAAKMTSAGYSSHAVGKWDAGIATPTHTPVGRGFATGLSYAEHMIDTYTQSIFPGGTACTLIDPNITDLWDSLEGGPARSLAGTQYVEYIFRDRVAEIVSNFSTSLQRKGLAAASAGDQAQQLATAGRGSLQHELAGAGDPTNATCPGAAAASASESAAAPADRLFLYYAPHIAHYPLQVPPEYLALYDWMTDDESHCNATTPYIWPGSTPANYSCRKQKSAMVSEYVVSQWQRAIRRAALQRAGAGPARWGQGPLAARSLAWHARLWRCW